MISILFKSLLEWKNTALIFIGKFNLLICVMLLIDIHYFFKSN